MADPEGKPLLSEPSHPTTHKPSYEAVVPAISPLEREPSRFRRRSLDNGQSFHQALGMPSAPPLSSLRDTYTHATGDRRPEPLGRRHDDLCAVRSPSGHPAPSSSGRWWSPQQLDKLVEGNASCPHDHYYQAAADGGPSSGPPSGSIPVAVPVAVPADSDPIFFTDEQVLRGPH